MNFLKKTNDFTLKVAKGMIAIFAIKLIIFMAVFTFQACSKDEDVSKTTNNREFKNVLEVQNKS